MASRTVQNIRPFHQDIYYGMRREYSRILELANSPKLLALYTTRVIWITLDLLLSASDASNSQSLARFPCFCDAPMRIDYFTVDNSLTVSAIIVEVTHAFSWDFGLSDKARQELRSCPNLWSKAIFAEGGIS